MPYNIDELKQKESYQKIIDADKNELKKFFEDEELRAEISGSTPDSFRTLRDAEGCILSYEDPENLGNTYPSNIQLVRVPVQYFNTIPTEVESKLKKERKFGAEFRPNEPNDTSDDIEALRAQLLALIEENRTKLKRVSDQEIALDNAISNLNAQIAELSDD